MVGDNLEDLERMKAGKSTVFIPVARPGGGIDLVPDDCELAGLQALQVMRSRWPNHVFYPNGLVDRKEVITPAVAGDMTMVEVSESPVDTATPYESTLDQNNRLLAQLNELLAQLIKNNTPKTSEVGG